MKNDELDALDRELAAVSDRIAQAGGGESLAAAVRKELRRPILNLAVTVTLTLGLGLASHALGLEHGLGRGALWVGLALLVLVLPDQARAVADSRRAAEAGNADLFATAAEEISKRFTRQVVGLLFATPAVFALLFLATMVEQPDALLIAAAALLLYLPFHYFLRLRWTAMEMAETRRWREVAREAAGIPTDERQDEDDDEDDDEFWDWRFLGWLGLKSFWLFVIYLGPILALGLLVSAVLADDSLRPLIGAGGLAVLWALVWKFVMPPGEDPS